jgi:hypothetical protein
MVQVLKLNVVSFTVNALKNTNSGFVDGMAEEGGGAVRFGTTLSTVKDIGRDSSKGTRRETISRFREQQ